MCGARLEPKVLGVLCTGLRASLLLRDADSEGSSEPMGDLKARAPWSNPEKGKCKYMLCRLLFPVLFSVYSNIIHVTIVLVTMSVLLIGVCISVMLPWDEDMPLAS